MSIIVALLLVLSVVLNVLLLTRKKNPAARKKSVRSAILQGIQNVNELATVRERFQSIVSFSDGKQMPFLGFCLPGTTRKFIMRYAGVIVCGNDLSKLNISERFAVNRVRVVVPRSRILDIYADIQSFEVYDQQAGLFTSIRLEDQNREVTADLEEMRQNALKSGILSHGHGGRDRLRRRRGRGPAPRDSGQHARKGRRRTGPQPRLRGGDGGRVTLVSLRSKPSRALRRKAAAQGK